MKKLVVLIALLALVPVVVPAQAHSLTLGQRVTRLENKMACIRKIPAGRFQDFAWFGIDDPRTPANQQPDFSGFDFNNTNTWPSDPLINWGHITGLDFTYGSTPPADVYLLGIVNNSTCRGRFGQLTDPGFGRPLARATRMMHLRQLSRVQ
jgi:hypothetical protein